MLLLNFFLKLYMLLRFQPNKVTYSKPKSFLKFEFKLNFNESLYYIYVVVSQIIYSDNTLFIMMNINPKIHKNLIRICKQFNISIKTNSGKYKKVDIIVKQLSKIR